MGVSGTKHWSRIESYGPKFVENITQGISRDILCHAMRTLSYYRIVGHIHDELIIEVSRDASLDAICEPMGMSADFIRNSERWAAPMMGLPISVSRIIQNRNIWLKILDRSKTSMVSYI